MDGIRVIFVILSILSPFVLIASSLMAYLSKIKGWTRLMNLCSILMILASISLIWGYYELGIWRAWK